MPRRSETKGNRPPTRRLIFASSSPSGCMAPSRRHRHSIRPARLSGSVRKCWNGAAGKRASVRPSKWQRTSQFRDATDAVTQRNFIQGQYVGTTAYFYTRDHLGSIREMFTGGGTVVARYDYDPYGRSTTVLGTTPTDFNFTDLYRHSKSNLDLAVYRSYDPDLGRWLSRDPLKAAEMQEGPNLYGYVRNEPTNHRDPSGLQAGNPNI